MSVVEGLRVVEQLGGAKQKVAEDRNRDSKPHCDVCTMALPVGTESCESSNQKSSQSDKNW